MIYLSSSMSIEKDHQEFRQEKLKFIDEYQKKFPQRQFNHRIYRILLKKFRRKLRRQTAAKQREEKFLIEKRQRDNDPLYRAWLVHQENLREERIIEEQRQNEKARRLWEEREAMVRQKIQLREQNIVRTASIVTNETSSFHNPFAPIEPTVRPGIERAVCSFYLKTGVCRYNDRCHRVHHKPDITNTLLAVNMYSNFELQFGLNDEFDSDIGLEFEESERYENFREFYFDVLPEFEKFGNVIRFFVCSNVETHLRGNVYIQYETKDEAMRAFLKFNSRYYAGRMIQCEFVDIRNWSQAICGLSQLGKCSKGRRCNYLHVFRNPSDQTKKRKIHR